MRDSQRKLEFSFQDVFMLFKQNAKTLIILPIAGAVIGLVFALFFVQPKYGATVDLLVNQKANDSQAQFNVQQADLQAINTYKDILNKPVVLTPVLKDMKKNNNYNGSLKDLQKSVKATNETNSQVLSVTITDDNPYLASDIANSIGKVFTKKIEKIMKIDNVTIVTKAKPVTRPVSPSKKLYTLIGFVAGFLMSLVIIIVKQVFDNTIKDSEYITNELGIVNLGTVFHIDSESKDYKVVSVLDKDDSHISYGRKEKRV